MFIFCVISIPVFSQNESENLSKYWQYRARLVDDFMLVGEGEGKSLPASGRDPVANCPSDWWLGNAGCRKPALQEVGLSLPHLGGNEAFSMVEKHQLHSPNHGRSNMNEATPLLFGQRLRGKSDSESLFRHEVSARKHSGSGARGLAQCP